MPTKGAILLMRDKNFQMNIPTTQLIKRKVLLLFFLSAFFLNCHSARRMGKSSSDTIGSWYRQEAWLDGLQLKPHESINQDEFYRQYQKNKTWWDEAFHFLKTHDLAKMNPGQYVIDSNNVIATISEVIPKDRAQVKWEAHRNFNDLQYIIQGKTIMGIAAVTSASAVVTTPYDPAIDTENFSITGETYYDATPGTFFIFSPFEMHRPAFRAPGYDRIKKIVIKVRVPK